MKTKYCLPIIESKSTETFKIIKDNFKNYDYFEIWLDYIEDLTPNFIDSLKKEYNVKLIFLFRRLLLATPNMSYQKRIELVDSLSNSKCLLDLDIFSQKKELEYLNKSNKHIQLILSYHNYQETPDNKKLRKIIDLMMKYNPYIYKISTFCKKDQDALRLIDLSIELKDKNIKNVILGMGDKGTITRIAGVILENEISFTPVDTKSKSAPGQLTKEELEEKVKNIQVCYFIADPARHSMSPQMHEAGYRSLGIEDKFLFLRQKVVSKDLKKFIDGMRINPNIIGACISVPHKIEIMKYLDILDETAKKIGAVNTVVKEGGKLRGYNTDWIGILTPLKQITHDSLNGKTAAVVGAGGAARAATYALTLEEAKVTIFNRDIEKGKALAEDFNCKYDSLDNIKRISEFDIIIHATKIGLLSTDSPLISEDLIKPNQIVFDVVYSRDDHKTELIKQANNKNAKTISGIEMLLHQGVAQFELFTGQKVSIDVMRSALT